MTYLIILTVEQVRGKSIILDAVVMLIGGKADTTLCALIQTPHLLKRCVPAQRSRKRSGD
ncbi:hypothetical protein [Candidatus Villigracilis affinis]|uniref:hypothetical protein n=1 Tax=Candidatus Villigracilis affinis TaxID=3140682 RepID=UPI002A1DCA15|nr:hypothetical protein [Anaerolineales bacterium]